MGNRVDFQWTIGDRVLIVECGLSGFIDGMLYSADSGIMYRVVYWTPAGRQASWLQDFEIRGNGMNMRTQ